MKNLKWSQLSELDQRSFGYRERWLQWTPLQHVLVHTGKIMIMIKSNFFDELDIRKPDYFLNSMKGVANTIAPQTAFDQLLIRHLMLC